jgi:hypothetical protein
MLAGRTPDLSLGVAQIRLSTLRRIAREADLANGRYSALRVSEATLVASLHNECASLKLAAVVMYHYLKHPVGPACDIDDESCSPADAAAAAFNGSPKPNGAIVAYGPVVRAGADMLHDDQGP